MRRVLTGAVLAALAASVCLAQPTAEEALGEAEQIVKRIRAEPRLGRILELDPSLRKELEEKTTQLANARTGGDASSIEAVRDELRVFEQIIEAEAGKLAAAPPRQVKPTAGPQLPTPAPPASPKPPPELVAAGRAYFNGEYSKVEGILQGATLDDERARFYAHLFRAAAYHALYLFGGEEDESLLRRAEAEVRECRKPDLNWNRDPFSPRFRAFYDNTP